MINPEDYTTCVDRNLKIKCSCGNVFTTSYANFIRAGIRRCPVCVKSNSSGEVIIENYLDSIGIRYEREKRFNDCRDRRTLPFDFYLPGHNLIIEFDGQQHYYPIFGEESFLKTKKHDIIKDSYCNTNKINILRIPYWDGHRIKELIDEALINIG